MHSSRLVTRGGWEFGSHARTTRSTCPILEVVRGREWCVFAETMCNPGQWNDSESKRCGTQAIVTPTRCSARKVPASAGAFPTTRSTTWSRPMVALTSALRDRSVQTRALYSVSFCHRRADPNYPDEMIEPLVAHVQQSERMRRIGVVSDGARRTA
jgi:hypothetical protein